MINLLDLLQFLNKVRTSETLITDRCRIYGIPHQDCVGSVYTPGVNYESYVKSFNLPINKDPFCNYNRCLIQITKKPLAINISKDKVSEENLNESLDVKQNIKTIINHNTVTKTVKSSPKTVTICDEEPEEELKTASKRKKKSETSEKFATDCEENVKTVTVEKHKPSKKTVTVTAPSENIKTVTAPSENIKTVTSPSENIKTVTVSPSNQTSMSQEIPQSISPQPQPQKTITVTQQPSVIQTVTQQSPVILTVTQQPSAIQTVTQQPSSIQTVTQQPSAVTTSVPGKETVTTKKDCEPEVIKEKTIIEKNTVTITEKSDKSHTSVESAAGNDSPAADCPEVSPDKDEKKPKPVEPEVITLIRYKTETKIKEKPLTLYREMVTTVEVEKPIINYKITTFTKSVTLTKTIEKEALKTVSINTEVLPEKKSDKKVPIKPVDVEVPEKSEKKPEDKKVKITDILSQIDAKIKREKHKTVAPEMPETIEKEPVEAETTEKDSNEIKNLIKLIKNELKIEKGENKPLTTKKNKKYKTRTIYNTTYAKAPNPVCDTATKDCAPKPTGKTAVRLDC